MRAFLAFTCALGLGLLADRLPAAQRPGVPEVSLRGGWSAPISDGQRTIALVSGRQAKPSLADGRMIVEGFRLETFRYAPEREVQLVVESPSAVFDILDARGGAFSDSDLSLRSADGRFSVEGTRWAWNKATGLLVVSNDVRATFRRAGISTNRPPVELRSQRLEYNLQTGATRFIGDCRAVDPERARLLAGVLVARLLADTERPESIFATNGVTVEMLRAGSEGRASGEAGTYQVTADGEQIELTGRPTWAFATGTGSADRLLLLPGRDAYRAIGQAKLLLQLDARAPASGPASKKTPLEISSEAIDATPGEVVFSGPVTVRQTNGLEMTSARLVAEFSGSAAAGREGLHRATATGGVQARLPAGQETLALEGREMVLTTGEHVVIEVSGEPSWQARGQVGQGGRFVIHPEVPTFQVVDGVRIAWSGPGNQAGPPGDPAEPVKVEAAGLWAEGQRAELRGGVVLTRDTWRLESSEVDLSLTTNAVIQSIQAREDVVFVYHSPASTTPMGTAESARAENPALSISGFLRDPSEAGRRWTIRSQGLSAGLEPGVDGPATLDATGGVSIEHLALAAGGGRLAYRATDGLLRLLDEPWLRTVDGLEVVGEAATALGVDPSSDRFFVEGAVRKMTFPAGALRGPNSVRTPKPQ